MRRNITVDYKISNYATIEINDNKQLFSVKLVEAAKENNLEAVIKNLKNGADSNYEIIFTTHVYNHNEYLVKMSALTCAVKNLVTPGYYYIPTTKTYNDTIEIIKLLLKNGANPNFQSGYNKDTLFHEFCSSSSLNIELLSCFLEANADLEQSSRHCCKNSIKLNCIFKCYYAYAVNPNNLLINLFCEMISFLPKYFTWPFCIMRIVSIPLIVACAVSKN